MQARQQLGQQVPGIVATDSTEMSSLRLKQAKEEERLVAQLREKEQQLLVLEAEQRGSRGTGGQNMNGELLSRALSSAEQANS